MTLNRTTRVIIGNSMLNIRGSAQNSLYLSCLAVYSVVLAGRETMFFWPARANAVKASCILNTKIIDE